MRSSLTRFIPFNEAGAGFAGDATGLRGGAIAGRGEVASLRYCARDCCLDGQRHGFTRVSRAARAGLADTTASTSAR
ncbi:hypothetical protein [Corynebacterium durum]|uniref:hypothetical protein n=1 Tax=Corynebacterium durum TaxID=61592 RepID=UPI0028E5C331|nr:hypothetical protein [Corynebacterium durum]